jgi:hypothetical protein
MVRTFAFTADFYHALSSQLWLVVMVALITLIGLWVRRRSYGAEGGWTLGIVTILCLVAFFPNGFHWLFQTGAYRYSYFISSAPSYLALFLADIVYTVTGAIAGLFIRFFAAD